MRRERGFTLLEVMVAVAILGLGLTAILSAQAGAFSAAARARNLSIATSLARCKMGEIEEHLLKDGFQELEEQDSGLCCEGDETPNLKCSWKIEKPQFPEPKLGEMDLDTGLSLSAPSGGSAPAGGAAGAAGAGGPLGGLGALGGLLGMPSSGGASVPDPAAGLGGLASQIGGAAGGDALGGMLQLVGTFVYPSLKAIFEANTRKITLTVSWTEGQKENSFDVIQWVTNPTPGLATNEALDLVQQMQGGSTGSGAGNGNGMGGTGLQGGGLFPGGGAGRGGGITR